MNRTKILRFTPERLIRPVLFLVILTLCALISIGTDAGGDRRGQKKRKGKSSEKKEERARPKDSGAKTKRSDAAKHVDRLIRPRKNQKSKDDRKATPRRGRDQKRSDEPRVERERQKPIHPRDRWDRRKNVDKREGRDGRRKKKINPGYRKRRRRKGVEAKRKIKPRPGRKPPPKVEPRPYRPRPPRPPYRPPYRPPWHPPRPWPPPDPIIIHNIYIIDEEPDYVSSKYEIHLPAGIIEPDRIDKAFIEKVNYIRSMGRGDSLLVCLFQTKDAMTEDEINHLFDRGVTFYRFLTPHTAIIDVSAENILVLVMDMPNFRWIGEYLPQYKYRHDDPESARHGAYVRSLVGDGEGFRMSLEHIGIEVVEYDEDMEDYYVIAEWEVFPEIAGLWWVEKVYKEPESFSEVYTE